MGMFIGPHFYQQSSCAWHLLSPSPMIVDHDTTCMCDSNPLYHMLRAVMIPVSAGRNNLLEKRARGESLWSTNSGVGEQFLLLDRRTKGFAFKGFAFPRRRHARTDASVPRPCWCRPQGAGPSASNSPGSGDERFPAPLD